ncbi:MAG: hypothetical protein M5U16_16245 [Hyphomicrobium sp.]|nr:hypothetical protein [Hyphomicrobium sp.]
MRDVERLAAAVGGDARRRKGDGYRPTTSSDAVSMMLTVAAS